MSVLVKRMGPRIVSLVGGFGPAEVALGADVLRNGGVVAVPTDTIYGLATTLAAADRLYAVKGRCPEKPIALALPDVAAVGGVAQSGHLSPQLLDALLPGPRTLVLRRTAALPPHFNPDTELVGLRIPDAPFLLQLCRALAQPLALTSANLSHQPSSLSIHEFEKQWAHLDLIFDGGRLESTRDGSTVVDLSLPHSFRILRRGSAYDDTLAILKQFGIQELTS